MKSRYEKEDWLYETEKETFIRCCFRFIYSDTCWYFFFIGNQSARKQIENLADGGTAETFYAEISDRKNNFLRVTGLEINDINFRGDFVFSIDEETKMTWRYTEISVEDLDIGDTVSITFTGEIQETAPAKITHVTQIQLLEDEK